MRKINKKRVSFAIVAFILLLGIVFGITKGITYVMDNSKKLELIGDANQTIMLHSVYDDPGVNLPEAKVEGKVDTSKAGVYELSYTKCHSLCKSLRQQANCDEFKWFG